MNYLLLIALFASSAAAREFSFDPQAMKDLAAGAQALKAKHNGRPRPALVSDYAANDISFRLISAGGGRDELGSYANKSIEFYFKESLLATLDVNDEVRGWADARRVLKAFESLTRSAVEQNRRVVIDYDAIQRQNKARAWSGVKNSRECELFDEIIRMGRMP